MDLRKEKKKEKGSIAIFVLVALLFMSAFLIILYGSNVNKSKIVKEQYDIISEIYAYGSGESGAYDKAYTDLRNKNKQTMTVSVEDVNTIELTKTFEGALSNYRIYGWGEAAYSEIQKEYKLLEYIEGTGTQYIDTKYISSEDSKPYKIEAEFQFTDVSQTTFVFGTSKNNDNHYPLVFGVDSEKNAWMFGHYGELGSSVRFGTADKNRHSIKYVFGEGLYFDGVLENTTVEQASASSNSGQNIGLFARIMENTPNGYGNLKIYGCKFYEADDKLVRNFIPVQRIEDGKNGMYDTVTKTFFENARTGDFVAGELRKREIQLPGLGEHIKNDSDSNYGKYKIPVKLINEKGGYLIKDIIIDRPIYEGEYIEFKTQKLVKIDGTEESINIPEISIYEDYTKIEVLTKVIPSKIEVEYLGYTITKENIDGYNILKYIEGTGTQYIDTKYISSEDYKPYKIEVEFEFTDVSQTTFVFGTVQNTGNNFPLVFGVDSNQNAWMFGHYGNSGSSVRFGKADTNKHTIKYVFGEGLYFDGILEDTTVEQASESSNSGKNIGLFTRIVDNTPNGYSNLRIYSCRFYEKDNKLVRNFLPVQRIEDGKVGMYDVVTKTFFESSGTGDFVAGPKR